MPAEGFRELFDRIAAVGRSPSGWTRPPWSDEVATAEAIVIEAGSQSGLVPERDPAGNLWLLDPAAPAVGLIAAGSHLDTVPDGGAFDGALGIVSAVLAVGALRTARVEGADRLAVIVFADEEGWRFGTPIFGSRMMTGVYGADVLERTDASGVRLADLAPPDPLAARGLERRLAAFLEVHVEQGAALAPAGAALGVATGLAARSRFGFSVDGEANHAGTTPMAGRRDALVGAARVVLAADIAGRAVEGAVATVGTLQVEPGGSNVIPGRAAGTLDVRAPTPDARDAVVAAIRTAVPDVALTTLAEDHGVRFAVEIRNALHAAAKAAGIAAVDVASYAGHDAGVLAAAAVPAGMLFVRSPTGVSHSPREHADERDCLAGVAVLEGALRRLLAYR